MRSKNGTISHIKLLLAFGMVSAALSGCGGSVEAQKTAAQAGAGKSGPPLATSVASVAPVAPGTIRMHFHRAQGPITEWGVYSWDGPQTIDYAWITGRFMIKNTDSFGGYVDIPVNTSKSAIWFLVTDGYGNKNCGSDQHADFSANIAANGQEVWMLEGDCTVYSEQPALSYGNLNEASAHWLNGNTIACQMQPKAVVINCIMRQTVV